MVGWPLASYGTTPPPVFTIQHRNPPHSGEGDPPIKLPIIASNHSVLRCFPDRRFTSSNSSAGSSTVSSSKGPARERWSPSASATRPSSWGLPVACGGPGVGGTGASSSARSVGPPVTLVGKEAALRPASPRPSVAPAAAVVSSSMRPSPQACRARPSLAVAAADPAPGAGSHSGRVVSARPARNGLGRLPSSGRSPSAALFATSGPGATPSPVVAGVFRLSLARLGVLSVLSPSASWGSAHLESTSSSASSSAVGGAPPATGWA